MKRIKQKAKNPRTMIVVSTSRGWKNWLTGIWKKTVSLLDNIKSDDPEMTSWWYWRHLFVWDMTWFPSHLTFGSHPKFSEGIPGSFRNINSRNPEMIDSNARKRLICSRRTPFPMVWKETNNQKYPYSFTKHLSHPDRTNKGMLGYSLS